jgi:hypothetical protein
VATPKERAEARRQEKLAVVQEQVEEGSLKIRKMTAKEKKENPPKPRPEKGKRRPRN